MRGFRILVAILCVVALASQSAWAGSFVIGRYAGEFLSLGAGSRALAMGGASTACPAPASSPYYNPSGLAGLSKRHAEFMHASVFDNLYTYDYLSFAQPMRNGYAGGITLLYTRVSDIPITRKADPSRPLDDNNRVVIDRNTGDHEVALVGALGRQLNNGWKLGASAKLLMKSVADESAAGLGFDLGASRSLSRRFAVGASVRDLTTSVLAWSTGRTEAILPSIVVGGAYKLEIPSANAAISVAADLDGHFESRGSAEVVDAGPLSVQPRAGLEYLIAHTVALRGGFNGEDWTAGAGLNLAWLNVGAAFQNHEDLGFTHRVSAAVAW